jgi:hypothetical protein
MHPHALLRALKPAAQLVEPLGPVERRDRDLELGPQLVQVPAQAVLDPGALGDEVLAVVDEQLDLLGFVVDGRRRQAVDALPERRAGDRDGVERVRLAGAALRAPPISLGATRTTRSPWPTRERSSAPETWRQSSTAQTRSSSSSGGPSRAAHGGRPRWPRPSRCLAARRSRGTPPRRCALTYGVRSDHDHVLRPFVWMTANGRTADGQTSLGRMHAPVKSRRRSSGGRWATQRDACQSSQTTGA